MNEKDIMTEAEEWHRHQSTMLSTFEEIALTFLNSVNGERESKEVFTSLQEYLDSSILINGAYSRRRTVVLAIHDMDEKLEAPIALQDKTLNQLEFLGLRPVPLVRFYQDIATAILRMEVVIRLKATPIPSDAPAQWTPEASEQRPAEAEEPWTPEPIEPQAGNVKQMPWENWAFGPDTPPKRDPWPLWKLAIIGGGIATAACLAGAFVMFGNGPEIRFNAPQARDLAAGAEMAADTQARARNCVPSSGDERRDIKASECKPSQLPDGTQPTLPAPATAPSAPVNVTSLALNEAVPGVMAPSGPAVSPQEQPKSLPWAVSVEAAFRTGPAAIESR